jgi:hypothetical protein
MNEMLRVPSNPEAVKLLPWAPERNGEALATPPPPRPGFWTRLARRLGLDA